jgi:hypothetical protein
MTQEEWEAAGSMHPPIAMRVKARSRLDRFFTVESADFGAHFRDMLGQTYSGRYGSQAPSRVAPIFILTDSANHLQCQELEDWVGPGKYPTLHTSKDGDIVRGVLELLHHRVTLGFPTFFVEVRAHRAKLTMRQLTG